MQGPLMNNRAPFFFFFYISMTIKLSRSNKKLVIQLFKNNRVVIELWVGCYWLHEGCKCFSEFA